MKKWIRYRFHANADDFRPVLWPPLGPCWCSGYGDDYSVVVAYLPKGEDLLKFWPEANNIESEDCESITYSSRFVKPNWWKGE